MTRSARNGRRLTAVLALAAALGVAGADTSTLALRRDTPAGKAVLVRGFAEFDAACALVRVQTITVVKAPHDGRVETRPGPVTVGNNWVGGGHCEGTTLAGVNVYYVPAQGFTGSDQFSMDIGYSHKRVVHAEVDIDVR